MPRPGWAPRASSRRCSRAIAPSSCSRRSWPDRRRRHTRPWRWRSCASARRYDRLGSREAAVGAYQGAVAAAPDDDPYKVRAKAAELIRRAPSPRIAEAYRLSLEGWRSFEDHDLRRGRGGARAFAGAQRRRARRALSLRARARGAARRRRGAGALRVDASATLAPVRHRSSQPRTSKPRVSTNAPAGATMRSAPTPAQRPCSAGRKRRAPRPPAPSPD